MLRLPVQGSVLRLSLSIVYFNFQWKCWGKLKRREVNDKVERNLNDADGVEGRKLFQVIKETKGGKSGGKTMNARHQTLLNSFKDDVETRRGR